MSKLTDFYLEEGTDCEGRTLSEIWQHHDDWFEACHDYVQWLFPLADLSNFNENAPILTEEDIAQFNNNTKLAENLLTSFFRFLKFLGLEYKNDRVVKAENYDDRMFIYPNHYWFRISRVLKCMNILGHKKYALTFFEFLEKMHIFELNVTENTFSYWKEAVR